MLTIPSLNRSFKRSFKVRSKGESTRHSPPIYHYFWGDNAMDRRQYVEVGTMRNEHTAYSLLHGLVTRGLPAISLCMLGLVMLSAAEAASTTITINDLTDTLSVSTTDTSGRFHTA